MLVEFLGVTLDDIARCTQCVDGALEKAYLVELFLGREVDALKASHLFVQQYFKAKE